MDSSEWFFSQSVGLIHNGKVISLAMKRNEQGVFIKLHIERLEGFNFVPMGENGLPLKGFLDLLLRALDLSRISSSRKIFSRTQPPLDLDSPMEGTSLQSIPSSE